MKKKKGPLSLPVPLHWQTDTMADLVTITETHCEGCACLTCSANRRHKELMLSLDEVVRCLKKISDHTKK